MMNSIKSSIKNWFEQIFAYKNPDINYNFYLAETQKEQEFSHSSFENEISNTNSDLQFEKEEISCHLKENLDYMKLKYNTLINSDVIIREFTITAKGKEFPAFLFYIDGMSDSNLINDFILEPLMLKNEDNLYTEDSTYFLPSKENKQVPIKKIKKFDLTEYINNCLLPQNALKKETKFSSVISGINMGNCALFVESLNIAFNLDVKGFKQRSVSAPNNEIIIKGPHEAFVEAIRTNTSLLRRIVNNENLIIENVNVGDISKTACAICYMKDITNNDLVAEVRYRLNNLKVDTLLSSGELEQLIEETNKYSIPQILSTERPDKAAKHLFAGKVVVIINGNPYCLIMPATFIDFLGSPEDTNLKFQFANFLKFLRIIAMLITLLLPGLYIAITNFHQELIPTELLFSIIASRENVPFPVIFEILVMEISFELIREAGLRVPSPIGPTIGIVGALVLRASSSKC